MEELVLVSEELEPYVLEIQPGSEIDGVVDCFTLAVMRRADGVLLAMPAEALPQEVVDAGNREDSTGIFGPSTVVIVPGVVQNNVGPTGQDLPVLLIDCGRGVSAFLRQPEIGEEMTFGFDEDRPHALPSPDGLLSAASQWVASASGRPSFYTAESAEEEDVVQEPVAPPLPKRQQRRPGPGEGTPSAKGGAKPKRMTTAALASSMEGLMLAIPKLTDQLQTLAERQQAVEDHLVGAPLPARAQLARPLKDLQHSSQVKPRFFGKGNVPCSSNSAAAGYGHSGSFDSEACNSARVGGREDEGGFRSNKPSSSSSRPKPGLDHSGVADSSSRTRPNGRSGWLGVKHFNSGCTRSSSSARIGQASGDFLPSSSSTDGPPDGSNFSGRGDPGRVGGERNHRDPLLGEVRWLRSFEGVGPASVSGHDGLGLSDARQHPCRQGHHCVVGGDDRTGCPRPRKVGDCKSFVPSGGCACGCVYAAAGRSHVESFCPTCRPTMDYLRPRLSQGNGGDLGEEVGVHRRRRKGFYTWRRRGQPEVEGEGGCKGEGKREEGFRRRGGSLKPRELFHGAVQGGQHEESGGCGLGNPLRQTISFQAWLFRDGFWDQGLPWLIVWGGASLQNGEGMLRLPRLFLFQHHTHDVLLEEGPTCRRGGFWE